MTVCGCPRVVSAFRTPGSESVARLRGAPLGVGDVQMSSLVEGQPIARNISSSPRRGRVLWLAGSRRKWEAACGCARDAAYGGRDKRRMDAGR